MLCWALILRICLLLLSPLACDHDSNTCLPNMCCEKHAGTGKTSTVLAIARQLYGKNMQRMTLELNASDDRGIAVVRQEIQDFASTKSVFCTSFKLIVLDECDAMTKDAQFALRRVIEKYARYGCHLKVCAC